MGGGGGGTWLYRLFMSRYMWWCVGRYPWDIQCFQSRELACSPPRNKLADVTFYCGNRESCGSVFIGVYITWTNSRTGDSTRDPARPPANTNDWPDVVVMVGKHRRQWIKHWKRNIGFAGIYNIRIVSGLISCKTLRLPPSFPVFLDWVVAGLICIPWRLEIKEKCNDTWTGVDCILQCFNPLPAKLSYLNFHPLDVVSRCRDPQLQVGEN